MVQAQSITFPKEAYSVQHQKNIRASALSGEPGDGVLLLLMNGALDEARGTEKSKPRETK